MFMPIAGVDTDQVEHHGSNSSLSTDGPKLSLIFGPWSKTEFYVNAGTGFHSNDARGTVISVDPKSGDPADRVPGWFEPRAPKWASARKSFPGCKARCRSMGSISTPS